MSICICLDAELNSYLMGFLTMQSDKYFLWYCTEKYTYIGMAFENLKFYEIILSAWIENIKYKHLITSDDKVESLKIDLMNWKH